MRKGRSRNRGDGSVVEPENYGITNHSNGAIKVTDVTVSEDGWSIVDKAPADLLRGEMSMNMNGLQLVNGENDLSGQAHKWIIGKDESDDGSGQFKHLPLLCYIAGGNVNDADHSFVTKVTYTIEELNSSNPGAGETENDEDVIQIIEEFDRKIRIHAVGASPEDITIEYQTQTIGEGVNGVSIIASHNSEGINVYDARLENNDGLPSEYDASIECIDAIFVLDTYIVVAIPEIGAVSPEGYIDLYLYCSNAPYQISGNESTDVFEVNGRKIIFNKRHEHDGLIGQEKIFVNDAYISSERSNVDFSIITDNHKVGIFNFGVQGKLKDCENQKTSCMFWLRTRVFGRN